MSVQVNADIRYYTVHDDGTQTLSRVNTSHVGQNISTKAVGSSNRQDVTLDYKFAEGSSAERIALLGKLVAALCSYANCLFGWLSVCLFSQNRVRENDRGGVERG